MILKVQTKVTLLLWVLLGAFLALSAPAGLPVVLLIVPYVLLFGALYGAWMVLVRITTPEGVRGRPRRRLGTVFSLSTVLLLALQSLGQLGVRDVITVAAIAVVGYVYLVRSGVESSTQLPGG